MSDYRRLRIWQRARILSIRIHRMVGRLPHAERARRGDQLIRAANSIRHNIVEGSGMGTIPQFARYLRYSIASADELTDELQELNDVRLLPPADEDLLTEPAEIAAMISTFRQRILDSLKKP